MTVLIKALSIALFSLVSTAAENSKVISSSSFDSFNVKAVDGSSQSLAKYKGSVVLVVNVASKCGYTPQYAELQKIYDKYKAKGFVVLGFPCNQFGDQEPGSNAEVQKFCKTNYGVTFPVMAKIEVNGSGADPLYKWLTSTASGSIEPIEWNFTKFLIGRNGKVIDRFAPKASPMSITKNIEQAL